MAGKSTIQVVISGDASGAVRAFKDVDQESSRMDRVGSRIADVGSKMRDIGKNMTLFATVPIVGAGVAAVKFASDLTESMSKVDVVFGESAREIQEWARSAARAFGMSRQEALEAAGTFGNFLIAMGNGVEESKDMSKALIGLAADLASFNNVNPEEVLLALRAGLAGEAEPLRRFGVNLSVARLEAIGASVGIKKLGKDMTGAEKSTLAYMAIMEDTALAQGDFARTAGGLANQQRILMARFKDTAATLGQQLLPIALKLVEFVQRLIDKFQGLSPEMQKVILIAGGLIAAIGPVTTIIGLLLSPVGLVVLALAALAAGFYLLYQRSETFREAIDALVSAFKDGGFSALLDEAVVQLQKLAAAFWEWIKDMTPKALAQLGVWALALGNWILTTAIPAAVGWLAALALKFVEWVATDVLPKLPGELSKIAAAIAKWLDEDGYPKAVEIGRQLGKALLEGMIDTAQKIPGWIAGLPDMIIDALGNWYYILWEAGWDMARGLADGFTAKLESLGGLAGKILNPAQIGLDFLLGTEKRASGGPVSAFQPYIVGERGPELFVPGASGQIVPNHAMGGGVVVNLNFNGQTDGQSVMSAVNSREFRAAMKSA